MSVSIIIPAYNELNCISDSLEAYQGLGRDFQVIVVCNGCTDGSEMFIDKNFPWVELIVLEEGSKINAINEANKVALYYPRIYQDADVILDRKSILNIEREFDTNKYLFASPSVSIDESRASFPVKQYYKFIIETPAYKLGMVNSGIYILSKEGGEKIGVFPNVIADDGYVKGFLGKENLQKLHDSKSIVSTPKKLLSLIKIKTRSQIGNLQLKKLFEISPSSGENNIKSLFFVAKKSNLYFPFFCYLVITVICKLRASLKIRSGRDIEWERDETTRN